VDGILKVKSVYVSNELLMELATCDIQVGVANSTALDCWNAKAAYGVT
jgi:hypothetical protein